MMFAGLFGHFIVFLLFSPSLFSFQQHAAILICMENSSWAQSNSISSRASFRKSFKLYVRSGARESLETSLKSLGNYPRPGSNSLQSFHSSLLNILLKHRLSRFNCFFPLTLILMVVHLAHFDNSDMRAGGQWPIYHSIDPWIKLAVVCVWLHICSEI